MAFWRVDFTTEGERDFNKLDSSIRKRVVNKLRWLERNFENVLPEPLSYDLRDFLKLRIGQWRVVYGINKKDQTLEVHSIELRDKVYKNIF